MDTGFGMGGAWKRQAQQQMNLIPAKIFQLPVIGDVLAYVYLGPRYLLSKLINPVLFPLSGYRKIKRGTTVIWLPRNKEEIVKEGIGLLQLCDPDLFLRLTEQRLFILYVGTIKNGVSPSNRVFFLNEATVKWGAEGVAMFLAFSVWRSEQKAPFNIFRRESNSSVSRKTLDWMCQHSFSPAFVKSYTKVVEQREQIRTSTGTQNLSTELPKQASNWDGKEFNLLCATGKYQEAIINCTEAIKLTPGNALVYGCRGTAFFQTGDSVRAIADFEKAIRIDRTFAEAFNNLAWALATASDPKLRNGEKALEHAKKACDLTGWKTPAFLGTLAAAYAETGCFNDAIQWQKLACERLPRKDRMEAEIRLDLYRKGEPYRSAEKQVRMNH